MLTHLDPASSLAIGFFIFSFVLAVEASNGFHDTANAVATVIYTKSLPPVSGSHLVGVELSMLYRVATAWLLSHVLCESGKDTLHICALPRQGLQVDTQVSCRKRHVCVRSCRSATPCAPARTGNFFAIVFHSRAATKRTNHKKSETAKSRFGIFENSRSSKLKICREKISNRLRFNKPRSFSSQSPTKVQSSCFTVRRFPIHSHTDAQRGLFHLNSAPNEATTSIWLKAMMVCRDLRGNNEPSENGIRHGGGNWEPRGASRG